MTSKELLAKKVHEIWCKTYKKKHGKEYWTKGDYNKLDEDTKDYDRAIVDWYLDKYKEREQEIKDIIDNGIKIWSSYELSEDHQYGSSRAVILKKLKQKLFKERSYEYDKRSRHFL